MNKVPAYSPVNLSKTSATCLLQNNSRRMPLFFMVLLLMVIKQQVVKAVCFKRMLLIFTVWNSLLQVKDHLRYKNQQLKK
jgi:hypothetical protein